MRERERGEERRGERRSEKGREEKREVRGEKREGERGEERSGRRKEIPSFTAVHRITAHREILHIYCTSFHNKFPATNVGYTPMQCMQIYTHTT